ncbi:MAG: AAA family ATPase, partial [Gemmatimonadota bacterium]
MAAPHRVVLIGPECTGKTTLARGLAAALGAPWTPEAARLVDDPPRTVAVIMPGVDHRAD